MDKKDIRKRKGQKYSKSGSDEQNANVLVVPPDILKKLGISIDQCNSEPKISDNAAVLQDTGTVFNEECGTGPISNDSKKSSESSCLETASLMKKSVFLSPSFGATLTSLNSGEVEISNIDATSTMIPDTVPLEEIENKQVPSDHNKDSTNKQDLSLTTPKSSEVPMDFCSYDVELNGAKLVTDDCLTTLEKVGVDSSIDIVVETRGQLQSASNKLKETHLSKENENMEFTKSNTINITANEKLTRKKQDAVKIKSNSTGQTTKKKKNTKNKIKTSDFEASRVGLKHKEKEHIADETDVICKETNGITLMMNKNGSLSIDKGVIRRVSLNGDVKCVNGLENTKDPNMVGNGKQEEIFEKATFKHILQVQQPEVISQKEDVVTKKNNNNIEYNGSDENENICNGNDKETDQTGIGLKCSMSTFNNMVHVNKLINKINIISEEIIPSSDFKELRMCKSPILKSLTPVPLNSIIVPKRSNDFTLETEAEGASNSVLLNSSGTLTSQHRSHDSYANNLLQTAIATTCNTDMNEMSYTNTSNSELIGDLKNSNDVFKALDSSCVICGERLIKSSCNNCRIKDLPTPNGELMECKKEDLDTINKHVKSIEKLCLGVEENNDQMSSANLLSDDRICKNNFNSRQESIVDKKDSINSSEKKRRQKVKTKVNLKLTDGKIRDKEFHNNQLNMIVKANNVNNDPSVGQDKVKEIADYIKKYAHVYQTNKLEEDKKDNKVTNNKKDTIISKPIVTKSKLCIQGVEKPGGHKHNIKTLDDVNIFKTYTRQKKNIKPHVNTTDNKTSSLCNVNKDKEISLVMDTNSKSNKSQDFCVCYDFGCLNDSNYDDIYEHIHFVLHNDNDDLDTILSIYHDNVIYNDRTELDNIQISEGTDNESKSSKICWNSFAVDPTEITNEIECTKSIDEECDNVIADNNQAERFEDICNDRVQQSPRELENYVQSKTDPPIAPLMDISDKVITVIEGAQQNQIDNLEPAVHDTSIPVDPINNIQEEELEKNKNIKQLEALKKGNSSHEQMTSKQNKRKRLHGGQVSASEEPCSKKNIKCGVCKKIFAESEWNCHVEKKHNFVAWKDGEIFDFDDPTLLRNLLHTFETTGSMKCSNCHLQTTKFTKFIGHIKSCLKQFQTPNSRRSSLSRNVATCGVCHQQVQRSLWVQHSGEKHNYLAWADGQEPLDVEDETAVLNHLEHIITSNGRLKCSKCGRSRKRAKVFLAHIKQCDGAENSLNDSIASAEVQPPAVQSATSSSAVDKKTTCGICKQEVLIVEWTEHIGKKHNYLAWKDDATPSNWNDDEVVRSHLQELIRNLGGLLCYKCGCTHKRVRQYLSHIKSCNGERATYDESALETSTVESVPDQKSIECGVCNDKIATANWYEHIGREHNYLAWKNKDTPLEENNEDVVNEHLRDVMKTCKTLICYKCDLSCKRVKQYLTHIRTCGGGQSDLDQSTASDINSAVNSEQIQVPKEETVNCGVCAQKVSMAMWMEHIGREHKYLAWQQGQQPLDLENDEAVKAHLFTITRENNGLKCYLCNVIKKYPKTFQRHILDCNGSNLNQSTTSDLNSTVKSEQIEISIEGTVKCGVCAQIVPASMWMEHIGSKHNYLAWQEGQQPLDVDNEYDVKSHLFTITRKNRGLRCYQCQIVKKYPKTYQRHVLECSGFEPADDSLLSELDGSSFDVSNIKTDTVVCGVCSNVVVTAEWMNHLEQAHAYMAWIQGKPPLDLTDQNMVQKHLIEVSKRTGGLLCKNCGIIRKYAKTYIEHVSGCLSKADTSFNYTTTITNDTDSVTCAVCSASMEPKDWRSHAMKKHYNVAWIVGMAPIEINSPYSVEPFIKEYQQRHGNKLVCKTCGITRVSAVGFYAHIIVCGKTDEETDKYKKLCDICNCKYLCIYKSQHMTMHREKDIAIEKKKMAAKALELIKQEVPVEIVAGRRKAAEKAKTVIEKYTSNILDGSHCLKCGFTSDIELEMKTHVCVEKEEEDSESDGSVDVQFSTDEEDDDSDIDSNVSDEEMEARDRDITSFKGHEPNYNKIQRLPYSIKSTHNYMKKSAEEFISLHLTSEELFTQYRNISYTKVTEDELFKYMPPIEESCKIRYNDTNWSTCKRFGATKEKNTITMCTGSCVQKIRWVPPYVNEQHVAPVEYLSVLSTLSSDKPRYTWDEIPDPKPALVQIWDCGEDMSRAPELVMGLAFDCGPIWAFDWCPSGTRDVISNTSVSTEQRLGLLVVASANGSAYVFVVPQPSETKVKVENPLFYKLKPVVELRLVTDITRRVYQATAVKWSKQKGHAHIVVGYADGIVAYFDLENESPLLRYTENNVDIIYPYRDERGQGVCIEDIDVFPTVSRHDGGVTVTGSVSGAGTGALQAHTAAATVVFPPHWPAAVLAGDDNLVSQAVNELEWYGSGRRMGGMRALSGCWWCGRLAAVAAPHVKLMRTHPAYLELHRQVIATLMMVNLAGKRKKKNDELSMIMEPRTYDEAILKYGIELKPVYAKDKLTQQRLSGMPREAFPERFPLAEATSIAFCPSFKNHNKLAIATHAGIIFIMSV